MGHDLAKLPYMITCLARNFSSYFNSTAVKYAKVVSCVQKSVEVRLSASSSLSRGQFTEATLRHCIPTQLCTFREQMSAVRRGILIPSVAVHSYFTNLLFVMLS